MPLAELVGLRLVANRGNLCCYCAEPAIGLKSEPGDQAAAKDDAMMEPATEVRNVISFGPFSLFVAERLLKKADKPIPLGGRALDILIALLERPGEVVTHKELISTAWPDVTVEEANLRFQMAALRKVLGDGQDGARYISNVAGRGYCFVALITRASAKQSVPVTGIATTERVKKLPPRPARMVGRDDTVRALAEQLQMWRFVSVVGPGGIGKTTVAISVAHTLIDGFHDAVFFIDLAALTDPQLVPTAVASALGLTVQTQDPLVGLLAFIGDRSARQLRARDRRCGSIGRTRRQRGTTSAYPRDQPRSPSG